VEPDAIELRVLGCLLEKQRTTPDAYPLSLNALRLACNQSTARDPVVAYDEGTVREALDRLGRRRWTRLASGPGSRAPKFRHLLDEALGLGRDELAVLCVLLLRGPQTVGELKGRTERLHPFGSLDEVAQVLARLAERELAATVRRPGWKETRWVQRLGEDAAAGPEPALEPAAPPPASGDRVAALEDEVAALRRDLEALRAEVQALRGG
jgi:uncharacterized protein